MWWPKNVEKSYHFGNPKDGFYIELVLTLH